MHEAVGIVGNLAFGLSAVPQLVESIRQGHARGLSLGFITLMLIACTCTFGYSCFITAPFHERVPYLANYAFNVGVWSLLCRYKLFPRT